MGFCFTTKQKSSDDDDEDDVWKKQQTEKSIRDKRIKIKEKRNEKVDTCEQKEISLKLFSMTTFLVSGLMM